MFGLKQIIVKKRPPPSSKLSCKEGGLKQINHTPPPNILEGNRVVFEILVKKKRPPPINKKFHGKRGVRKIIHTPPQIFLKVME